MHEKHGCLTGIVFAIWEVVLRKLGMDGRHLLREVEGFLIAGDHALRAGARLVCCRYLQHSVFVKPMYTFKVGVLKVHYGSIDRNANMV